MVFMDMLLTGLYRKRCDTAKVTGKPIEVDALFSLLEKGYKVEPFRFAAVANVMMSVNPNERHLLCSKH